MKEAYAEFRFRKDSAELIATIDAIVEEYQRQGYRLTVRQLYYQLVARDIIPNTERSYKNTVRLVNDARLAGLIDWDAIEDRTRAFIRRPSWDSGASILKSCASRFHMDMWQTQQHRIFVLVEKEALAGVLERVCRKWDIPLLAARGYPSASVLREFAEFQINGEANDITILHLGDHDPSGIDMTRDLIERLDVFTRQGESGSFHLKRIALNMDQIDDQKPPPNPAKTTDSRFENYRRKFGDESWELDALQPSYLNRLVESHVRELIDTEAWTARQNEIEEIKGRIRAVAEAF